MRLRLTLPLLLPSVMGLVLSVGVGVVALDHFSQWQTGEQALFQLQREVRQAEAHQQKYQSWQSISPEILARYQGLKVSGQWGKQSRLMWIQRLEPLAQDKVQVMQMNFSERQALSAQRVVGWDNLPLTVAVETLSAELTARHEWHALSWLQTLDREVLPTSLLQNCDWQLQQNSNQQAEPAFVGLVAMKCRWLIMEMQE